MTKTSPILLLALLVLASLLVHALMIPWVPVPTIFPDELIYLELSRHLAQGHGFVFRGEPMSFPSVLYPLLLVPAQWAGDPFVAHRLAQATGALFMSLTAVPIYALARRFLPASWALAAAALSIAAPPMLYAHAIMTESLFFLVLMGLAYAVVRAATEDPLRWKLLLGALLGLAFFTKPQGMVLAPVAVAAFLAAAWGRTDFRRRLWAFWPAVAVFGAIASLHVLRIVLTEPGANMLALSTYMGTYAGGLTGDVPFTWPHLVGAAAAILGALALGAGFWPLGLFALFAARRSHDPAERAFVALTIGLGVVLIGLAARNVALIYPLGVQERYSFYVMPLVLIGAMRWLVVKGDAWGRGTAIALAALGLAVAYAQQATLTYVDTPSYAALYRPALTLGWPGTAIALAVAGGAYMLVLAFLASRERWKPALALVTAFTLTLTGLSFYTQVSLSRIYAGNLPFVAWVQSLTPPDATIAVLADGLSFFPVMLTDSFSRQTVRVYYLDRPMAAWLERELTPGPGGTLPALDRLPDGTRLLAHRSVPLALPVLGRNGDAVIYEKRGPVRREAPHAP